MRKLILKWLGAMDQEEHTKQIEVQLVLNQLLIDQTKSLAKVIDALKTHVTMSNYKYELILKYGCLDCFSVDGEWHKEDCQHNLDEYGHRQLVRRNNGRQPVGHS